MGDKRYCLDLRATREFHMSKNKIDGPTLTELRDFLMDLIGNHSYAEDEDEGYENSTDCPCKFCVSFGVLDQITELLKSEPRASGLAYREKWEGEMDGAEIY